ncbi:MAG: LLM class F420-dependent oxidoreductase [Rhodospirillales bacterium]|nr:LLM class F420-dependent oxidoreductase [Rhodospirillales bacterium]
MQIGCNAPIAGPLAAVPDLVRIVTEAEALGFDYATFSDHVVIPSDIASRYPYTDSGEFPSGARAARHEQLTTLAFLAAKTSRLRLVTSVMVVPHRPAVLTAKIVATLDVFSAGRVTLGIGAGWMQEEIEALGGDFAARGAVTDETLLACRALWTEETPSFQGTHVRFSGLAFEPKPVQAHLPIWIGGESGPALRRAAKLGDGWYPIGTNPQFPLDTLDRYKAGIAKLRRLTEQAGRDPASVALAYRVSIPQGDGPRATVDGAPRLFTGGPADCVADLRALRDLGVAAVDFSLLADTAEASVARMRRFRDEVMAKL